MVIGMRAMLSLEHTKYDRYFCTVDDEGDIVRLSEREVNDRFGRSGP